jgi:hypothetical protein
MIQVYVLNAIPPLHQLIVPYIYFLFILWMPFSIKRGQLLLLGFFLGLTVDYFLVTPGLHAAACTLIAYLRPFIITLLSPKHAFEFNYREPSFKAMGGQYYFSYLLILTVFHNGYLLFLEWLSFGSFFEFLLKLISTTAISILLIFVIDLIFPRRLKYRTNTTK